MKTLFSLLMMIALSGSLIAGSGEKSETLEVNAKESVVTWKGEKVGGEHHGTINVKGGSLKMDNGVLSSAHVTVDMTTIKNKDLEGNESMKTKLENHLRSDDFFSVEKFPESEFAITQVEKSKEGKYNVSGDLTIKGITHPISFPATVKKEGNKYIAQADFIFDRSKYDVRYGSKSFFNDLGDNLIYDDVELSVKLIAQ